jgi:SOS-response transcriptional repressor LexA
VKTPVKEISIETDNTSLDECVRTRDSEAKYTMKTSGDMKNDAVDRGISVGDTVVVNRGISVGDTVVVKRDIRGNKFDMEPRTIISRKGPMLTVSDDIIRNVSGFKKVSVNRCILKIEGETQLSDKFKDFELK